MKYFVSLLFVLILTSTYSQLYVSLGSTRKSERLITENHFKAKPYKEPGVDGVNKAYVNTYISGAARYRLNRFVFDAELSCLRKKELNFYAERITNEIINPVDGSPSYSEYKEHSSGASIDYSFIGLKLGASIVLESKSFIFKKTPRNETTFGFIFQGDFKAQEKEYNHLGFTTIGTTATGGVTSWVFYDFNSQVFDAVKTPWIVMSSGVRMDHTVLFDNFFCGLNVAVGFMLNNRYELLQGERYPEFTTPLKNHFFETGIFIGHKFKNKKE
jgi:hypothetical protein